MDDALLTSDPNISAIGECARHRGMCHGLVAPGYAMAEVAVQRLNGETVRFEGAQIGTRLKVKGLDLTVVGESTATGLGTLSHTYEQEGQYRRLVLRKGRVIGITALGTWNDLGRAQEAMAKGEKLRPLQLKRFEQDEAMWKQKRLSLRTWPDSATVCTCMGVTCGTLKRAYDEGAVSTEALAQKTGASTVCGSCKPLLATLAEEEPEAQRRSPWMVRFSVASALGAILFLLAPRVPLSPSVMTRGIDILYTDALAKQITGFTVLGFFSASILFSMRKRLSWFAWKEFESWRVAHAFLGVLCLVGAFFHTGFRLGTRLDLALMMTVLASCFLGGLAGGWELVEERLEPHQATALRAWLVRSHIYLLWPLPLLLLVHILKVYFF